jgi:hypothetical protein
MRLGKTYSIVYKYKKYSNVYLKNKTRKKENIILKIYRKHKWDSTIIRKEIEIIESPEL